MPVIVIMVAVVVVAFTLKSTFETANVQGFEKGWGQFFNGINKEYLPSFSFG